MIKNELIFKICLIGDKYIGKTSLVQNSIQKKSNKEGKPLTFIDIGMKKLIINSSKVTLQIWIFGCDPQFNFLFPVFLQGVSGCVFMYDITDYSSINNIEKWITTFKDYLPSNRKEIPILMVGSKLDQFKERVISIREAKKIAKKYNIFNYFECSYITGQNIEKIFEFLTRFMQKYEENAIKTTQTLECEI